MSAERVEGQFGCWSKPFDIECGLGGKSLQGDMGRGAGVTSLHEVEEIRDHRRELRNEGKQDCFR
ncbi:hypothetical protein CNAG_07392 [Cryptococcus neoformans var. grubii H99]|uniref:Uncharacterized protein n=1 Tax=Cryptococcus neoformans (strain H99 / ATCC 208821 / CBS 10515 / FGSC 9487) TaxID=235443 RepID=J9VF82_CRYN9|nr:hypothetical protein CNAG_07392 [Cryptococcus neoformans var. grubii H99]AFR92992.1 hypothetical protein CNAG_07392 [Cryptococcus neoformans var. grubii H99]AUB22477.1 hypothetical protein CKF44_07392 [Cryptococcus neoformans var. grubii]|eukprot:XP_012047071.1 hypothetical protein CNAG_07392 [Cryptococcus neoformans var. grubii H99]